MKIRFIIFLSILLLTGNIINVSAQTDSVFGQVSASTGNSFAGGMSGDGRLIVFESNGNVATENPRNEDGNREIFVFDYAQRRIFQITDTKVVLNNPSLNRFASNTRVDILNVRPVISNDGKWIAFSSNATSSTAGNPVNGTNPGNFNGDSFTNAISGADQLDVAAATGGETLTNIIQPVAPNTVRIRFTDLNTSISAFSVTVAGTDTGGGTISENFTFSGGLVQTGTQMFATVTSVTLDSITGNNVSDTLDFEYGDGSNPLTADGNMEMWLFEFQNSLTAVDLSQGGEIPLTDLSLGTFTQVTNTPPSRLPVAGSSTQIPIIAADNSDASISNDGGVFAFVSNRNLVANGNQAPADNPEIFTYVRSAGMIKQVTQTPRGQVFAPISNSTPTISGNGQRVMFSSNANNPIIGMKDGDNTDLNEEVFYADLTTGAPSGNNKQVTTTSPTNPGEIVNSINFGSRMSRDGKYLAFDSFADLANENSGTNFDSFATYLYDADLDSFRRIGARSDADDQASGGDVSRYPTFTDYVGGTPQTLVMETRLNITAQGEVPANEEDGLNNIFQRPVQIYSYPLDETPENALFTRLTVLPPPPFLLASIQIYPSDKLERMALTLPGSEIGTGNSDLTTEVYYLLQPTVTNESASGLSFATGATSIPVVNGEVPTPSPTPTPSPSPSPDPTPQTPPAVQGLSAGMLATVNFTSGLNQPVAARTAVGSLDRRFQLPMELAGVTMTIGGVSVGLKRVSRRQITFVVPLGLGSNLDFPFPVVINNNGIVIRGEIIIVPARPDIFRLDNIPPELNRAKILNITNRVQTAGPFDITTLKYRGGVRVPTRVRLYLTGVTNVTGSEITIRFGETALSGSISNAQIIEPGIYTIDFTLSPNLEMIGDQPIVLTVFRGGLFFTSRFDDTSPRVKIL